MDVYRDAARRHAAVFERHGMDYPAIVAHTSNAVTMNAFSFLNVIYNGEWGNHEGENCRDWLEKWNPDILRAYCIGRNLGLVATWHPNQMADATSRNRADGPLLSMS